MTFCILGRRGPQGRSQGVAIDLIATPLESFFFFFFFYPKIPEGGAFGVAMAPSKQDAEDVKKKHA